jgi:hypothetical protein
MTNATYRTMPALIATRTPFKHGSHSAYTDTDGRYRVWSYSTEIATAKGDEITFNERKYSVTTSRLQNIIRKAWNI